MSFSGRLDTFQRRHKVIGFPIAVIYKFTDDQGNYLAALMTYYGFLALFPAAAAGVRRSSASSCRAIQTCRRRSSTRRCRSSRSSATRWLSREVFRAARRRSSSVRSARCTAPWASRKRHRTR